MKFFKIKNNSNFDLGNSEELFHGLGQFAQKRFGFKKPPMLNLVSDEKNAGKLLGKTAYYDPQSLAVTIYTDNRHAKDILRSLAHELVHHTQNENGMLNDSGYHGEGYAQKNKDLRKSEKEAYLKGNMCFRDWEDQLKQDKPTIYNEWRINTMSTKDWKRKELMENLTEKFGFKMDLGLLKEASCGSKKKMYEEEELNEEKDDKCPKCDTAPCKCPDEKKVMKEKEDKKPDADGDGVPDYADKNPGEDDNKDSKEKPKSKGKKGKLNPGLQKYLDNKKKQNESRIYKFIKQEIRKQLMEAKKKSQHKEQQIKKLEQELYELESYLGFLMQSGPYGDSYNRVTHTELEQIPYIEDKIDSLKMRIEWLKKDIMEAKKTKQHKGATYKAIEKAVEKDARERAGKLTKSEVEERIQSFQRHIDRLGTSIKNAERRKKEGKESGNERRVMLADEVIKREKEAIKTLERLMKKRKAELSKMDKSK